jgi:hypothetical protein
MPLRAKFRTEYIHLRRRHLAELAEHEEKAAQLLDEIESRCLKSIEPFKSRKNFFKILFIKRQRQSEIFALKLRIDDEATHIKRRHLDEIKAVRQYWERKIAEQSS